MNNPQNTETLADDNGFRQAHAELKYIVATVPKLDENYRESLRVAGDAHWEDAPLPDEVRDEIIEGHYGVLLRYCDTSPGHEPQIEGFRIVLAGGGPSVELRGTLDSGREPDDAWIEYQDWGTPWTRLPLDEAQAAAVLLYARQFYFGSF